MFEQETDIIGKTNFNIEIKNDYDLLNAINSGIKPSAINHVSKSSGITQKTLVSLMKIDPKTFSRRKKSGLLKPMESDRLLAIAKVYAHTLDIFGTAEKTLSWLNEANLALKNAKPLDLLSSEHGCSLVTEVLYRIDYGIYS